MRFDINLLRDTLSVPLVFQETIAIPVDYGVCEDRLPLSFEGSVTKNQDYYTLEGQLRITLTFPCGKCLERVSFPLQLDVCERFYDSIVPKERQFSAKALDPEGSPPEDFFYFEGEYIDFTQAFETLVYLNIPPKVVCSEDCKGLCPRCGYDLNRGDCGCDGAIIDSRFFVLKSFFEDKEV